MNERWKEIEKLREDTLKLNKEVDDYVDNHKLDVTSEEYFKKIMEFRDRNAVLKETAKRLESTPY